MYNMRKAQFLAVGLMFATCAFAQAGTWGTITPIADDTNSGVVGGGTYTAAVDLGGSGVTVSGVAFEAGAGSGTGYFFDNDWQGASPDTLTSVSGNIATLLNTSRRPSHFFGFNNSDLTLTNLMPATDYVATFYFPGTTAGGTFGSGGDEFVIPGGLDVTVGYYVDYSFTTTGATKGFTLPANGSEDVRIAGFANRVAGAAPEPSTVALGIAGLIGLLISVWWRRM